MNAKFWGLPLLLTDLKGKAAPNTEQLHVLIIETYYSREQSHRNRAQTELSQFVKNITADESKKKECKKYYAEAKSTHEENQTLPRGDHEPLLGW